MSRKKERITLPGGREVLRVIPYPGPVKDGTPRCVQCGQIDESPWHDMKLCDALYRGTAILDMGKYFIPIDDRARDGSRQLVKRGPNFAAGMWTGDFWSYPYGKGEGDPSPDQIDFEPTHYWPQPPKDQQP
jgi:hypothetical protein